MRRARHLNKHLPATNLLFQKATEKPRYIACETISRMSTLMNALPGIIALLIYLSLAAFVLTLAVRAVRALQDIGRSLDNIAQALRDRSE